MADAALWGIALPEGWAEGWGGGDDEGDGVWPENAGAVHAFLEICTQFRTVAHFDGSLQRTGLDYPAARAGLELAGVEMSRELWDAIRGIEMGVLTAHREGGEA